MEWSRRPQRRIYSLIIGDGGCAVKQGTVLHQWAVRLARRVSEPLLTCEAVLAETAFHLESFATVFAKTRDGLIKLAFNAGDHLSTQ